MDHFRNQNGCPISYAQLRLAMDGEPYDMSLVGGEAKFVQTAVNQGIDSHLEACFCPALGDRYESIRGRLVCRVSVQSLPTLVRRLFEAGGSEDGDSPEALASSILDTLGFDESGRFSAARRDNR